MYHVTRKYRMIIGQLLGQYLWDQRLVMSTHLEQINERLMQTRRQQAVNPEDSLFLPGNKIPMPRTSSVWLSLTRLTHRFENPRYA